MSMMRTTRSWRFFFILVHLVVISHPPPTHHSSSDDEGGGSGTSSGGLIVGVQPKPVVLEHLNLVRPSAIASIPPSAGSSHQHTRSSRKRRREEHEEYDDVHTTESEDRQHHRQNFGVDGTEAVWLQDAYDGTCLGPTATFTACGDATLWFVRERPLVQRLRRKRVYSGIWGIDDEDARGATANDNDDLAWSFVVVNYDYYNQQYRDQQEESGGQSDEEALERIAWPWPWIKRKRIKQPAKQENQSVAECLVSHSGAEVSVNDCLVHTSERRQQREAGAMKPSWAWKVHELGYLQRIPLTEPKRERKGSAQQPEIPMCLWRLNDTQTMLRDCNQTREGQMEESTADDPRMVQMAFVRYRAVTAASSTMTVIATEQQNKQRQQRQPPKKRRRWRRKQKHHQQDDEESAETEATHKQKQSLSLSMDRAHSAAETSTSTTSTLALATVASPTLLSKRKKQSPPNPLEVHLMGGNPILLMMQNNQHHNHMSGRESELPGSSSAAAVPAVDRNSPSYKLRRIQIHPYLKTAQNNLWADPQTGLEYETDLCSYLGYQRSERGRQTLTGVGQYRKGFVIKIYGIAFYVSKRDVLANPSFTPYATMTAEQLRKEPAFYEMLRSMPSAGGGTASAEADDEQTLASQPGVFERTLLLKTNMQLSTETMRSSLEADWQMLSEDAKTTLISSSLRAVQADEDMLRRIRSPDNPSRCSCAQQAPAEYEANPDCCARGTELAFTWLKTGHLQVRCNGRLVDTFARPDIAQGIFFEYLRTDNPMSPEFIETVVDGFPFLLAPLAQVRGVQMGQQHHQQHSNKGSANPLLRAAGGLAESISSHAGHAAGLVQQGFADAAEHASQAARDAMHHAGKQMNAASQKAQSAGREMDRRRQILMKHGVAAADTVAKAFSAARRGELQPVQAFAEWIKEHQQEQNPVQALSEWMTAVWNNKSKNRISDSAQRRSAQPMTTATEVDKPLTIHNMSHRRTPITQHQPQGRVFGYPLSRWFGEPYYPAPDEIGPMVIDPNRDTTRKVFLALVHLYLLLVFIVSFPGSYTKTRAKLSTCDGSLSWSTRRRQRKRQKQRLRQRQRQQEPQQQHRLQGVGRYPSDLTDQSSCSSIVIGEPPPTPPPTPQEGPLVVVTATTTSKPTEAVSRGARANAAAAATTASSGRTASNFLSRARHALRPSVSSDDGIAEEVVSTTSTNPLKKKSFSYFL